MRLNRKLKNQETPKSLTWFVPAASLNSIKTGLARTSDGGPVLSVGFAKPNEEAAPASIFSNPGALAISTGFVPAASLNSIESVLVTGSYGGPVLPVGFAKPSTGAAPVPTGPEPIASDGPASLKLAAVPETAAPDSSPTGGPDREVGFAINRVAPLIRTENLPTALSNHPKVAVVDWLRTTTIG